MTNLATAEPTGAESARWDLTEYYSGPRDPEIEATLARALEHARSFEARYRGRINSLAPAEFAAMMRELEEVEEWESRPHMYASLLHSLDTQDPEVGRLVARVQEAGAERGAHMVFFGLEMAGISAEQAAAIAADPEASVYAHVVAEYRKYQPHQLSEVEERLLTERSPVGAGAWVRLFGELCAAIRADWHGERVPLTTVLSELRGPDREQRRAAAKAITAALDDDLRTRTYIFNVVLQDKAIDDRQRRYPRWISARNLSNEVSDEAVEALIQAVTERYDIVARYYRVKRVLLGLDQLHEWDRYAAVSDRTRPLAWHQAVELVSGSYHRFSDRAGELIDEFFEKGWIDAPVLPNKRGGAFCAAATPRSHPWVLLNFTGKLNDALTLAHELGHGLHDRMASRQHVFDYHPPLTLAETASVFGEQMTFDRIMSEERDPEIRLSMACAAVEDAFATIFRQVAMNRFEDRTHNARRTEGELSVEQVGAIWQEEQQRMFGDSLILTDAHRSWWSYVEHFLHTPGYVYAYAFGNLLALSLYRRYQELGPAFADDYLELLAAGGSVSPDRLLARVGIDLDDPAFWRAGLGLVEAKVAQVEELARAAGRI